MSMILILTSRLGILDTGKLIGLGGLGVSSVTLLEDDTTAGVLVQGWAFDHASATEGVMDALVRVDDEVKVLRPVMQVSVSHSAEVPTAVIGDGGDGEDKET